MEKKSKNPKIKNKNKTTTTHGYYYFMASSHKNPDPPAFGILEQLRVSSCIEDEERRKRGQ